jgi:hypothetical protein
VVEPKGAKGESISKRMFNCLGSLDEELFFIEKGEYDGRFDH